MLTSKCVLILATLPFLAACASGIKRGAVAMKVDETKAHVALNKGEVKVGDHIQLYANRCAKGGMGNAPTCEKVLKGHGQVTAVLNESYSEVTFEKGATFTEGDFIEKHGHQ